MRTWTQVPTLQPKLNKQIKDLIRKFPKSFFKKDILGVLLMGSCARGQATYRSDIDCLIVLKYAPLTFARIKELREALEKHFRPSLLHRPLQCEFHFVLPGVFKTKEPAMRQGLMQSINLLDPEGALKKGLKLLEQNQKAAA